MEVFLIIYLFVILLVILVFYAFLLFIKTFSESKQKVRPSPKPKKGIKKEAPEIKEKTPEIKEKIPATESIEIENVKQLKLKINSVKAMLNDLENKFQTGAITQDVYVEKKHFLSEKLGQMQFQLEQL